MEGGLEWCRWGVLGGFWCVGGGGEEVRGEVSVWWLRRCAWSALELVLLCELSWSRLIVNHQPELDAAPMIYSTDDRLMEKNRRTVP